MSGPAGFWNRPNPGAEALSIALFLEAKIRILSFPDACKSER